MKIYVLAENIPYEGYNSPVGVFSSEELARARLEKTIKSKKGRAMYDILEYEVDELTPK